MLFMDFTVEEYRERLARTQQEMRARKIDGMVLTDAGNLIYLTGYRTILFDSKFRPFITVIPQSGEPTLVLPNLEVGIGRKTSWLKDVRGWGKGLYADAPDAFTLVAAALEEKGIAKGRLATELGNGQRLGMSIDQFTELKTRVPEARWTNAADVMWATRVIKSPQEIEYMRVACKATDIAFEAAADACHEGVTEEELGKVLSQKMVEHSDGVGFIAISSGPDRYDMINGHPTSRKVQKGELVCFDIGATYKHYGADLSRIVYIGEPTQRQREFHEAEFEVFWAGVKAVKPGATCEEVDAACESTIKRLGFEKYMLHRTGHALGVDIHELPSVALGDKTVLKPGMLITIEPGLYDFSIGAWRIEDTVAVTETGYELLTNCERGIIVR